MLLSWGFYPDTRPTDWAFNQYVHALPPLPYDALVAAAAQLLRHADDDSSSSSNGSNDGTRQQLDAAVQGRLLAVIGSLPLQLPPQLLLLQAAGSAAAAAAAAETSYVPYAHAAAVALKYGLREDVVEPLEAAAAAASGDDYEVSAIAAERFKPPSSQQRELAQVRRCRCCCCCCCCPCCCCYHCYIQKILQTNFAAAWLVCSPELVGAVSIAHDTPVELFCWWHGSSEVAKREKSDLQSAMLLSCVYFKSIPV
jgi:hypothetical protein